MKAQICGIENYTLFVVLDNKEESKNIWLPEEELVELTQEDVELVLQYREIAKRYNKLCLVKKAEQDKKEF